MIVYVYININHIIALFGGKRENGPSMKLRHGRSRRGLWDFVSSGLPWTLNEASFLDVSSETVISTHRIHVWYMLT